jgi:hypothetical protein
MRSSSSTAVRFSRTDCRQGRIACSSTVRARHRSLLALLCCVVVLFLVPLRDIQLLCTRMRYNLFVCLCLSAARGCAYVFDRSLFVSVGFIYICIPPSDGKRTILTFGAWIDTTRAEDSLRVVIRTAPAAASVLPRSVSSRFISSVSGAPGLASRDISKRAAKANVYHHKEQKEVDCRWGGGEEDRGTHGRTEDESIVPCARRAWKGWCYSR